MNVVERIHEEVRINLIFQILHLLLEVALVDNLLAFSVALRHEVELHAEVHAHKQQSAEESYQLSWSKHWQRVDRLQLQRLSAHRVLRTAVASVAQAHGCYALVSQRVGFPLLLHARFSLPVMVRSVEVCDEHARQQYGERQTHVRTGLALLQKYWQQEEIVYCKHHKPRACVLPSLQYLVPRERNLRVTRHSRVDIYHGRSVEHCPDGGVDCVFFTKIHRLLFL